jgi:hypothetical protein
VKAAAITSHGYSTLVSDRAEQPMPELLPTHRSDNGGPPRVPVDEARDHVLFALALRTGIQPKAVLGKSRVRGVVYVRKLTSAALRTAGYPFACIGAALDRDHSSIIHQVNEIYAGARFHDDIAADLVWAIHAADELAGTSAGKKAPA